jgi:hypothetical protein
LHQTPGHDPHTYHASSWAGYPSIPLRAGTLFVVVVVVFLQISLLSSSITNRRCSQRAFRERKERHVKDLESRLQQLEQAQQETMSENERLKRDLQKISTENEILRATSLVTANSGPPGANGGPTTTGPMTYTPNDFYSNVLEKHTNKTPSHRIVTSDSGERLLAAGAAWEFIINHELFKRGLVDVGQVSDRIKPLAKCDGQGPVFEERDIVEAIKQSVASGSDELI